MPQPFSFPARRSPKSDPQQYRVYRMESEAIGARTYARLTRKASRSLARSVCRAYGVPQVKLVWRDLGTWAAEWNNGVIYLSSKKGTARDFITLTHELAHHIHWHLGGDVTNDHEGHGPEFMACHMSVLDTCRMIPVVGMREICKAWKVRFADPGTGNSLAKLQRIVRRRKRVSRSASTSNQTSPSLSQSVFKQICLYRTTVFKSRSLRARSLTAATPAGSSPRYRYL